MNTNNPLDPQQDTEATMLIPNPGGRRPVAPDASSNPAQTASAPPLTESPASSVASFSGSGLNPLVRAANALLDLVVPLRTTAQPPDLPQLRERLVLAIKTFESEARAAQIDTETIAAARYVLCTLLDESIASTAWGSGVWGTSSLLVAFHNEASGGEKVFVILQRLSQNPAVNLDLLELFYLCLSLGLEGRYRVLDQGPAQLATLRERLLQLIRQHRGAYEVDLSPEWRGVTGPARSPLKRVRPWLLVLAVCIVLAGLQLFFSIVLNRRSDPVFAALSTIRIAHAAAPVDVPLPVTAPGRITAFLAPEIARGQVMVRETAERCKITLMGAGMFGSGSAEMQGNVAPLLARIGDALQTLPGKVIVIGHTDDTAPGLSARFPSNYDLSKARASAVMGLLAQRAGPAGRYSVEGRGDTEPQVPNDTAAKRARNRRVDIVVLTPASAP